MQATLIHASGSRYGRKDKIRAEKTRLGRKPDNDIVFEENVVSSYHAEIRKTRDSFSIIDLESTNGTYLNGNKVSKAHINNGDRIEIGEGGPSFEFHTEEPGNQSLPRIIPKSGPWESMEPIDLGSGSVTLGRSPENDVVVGRAHGSVVSSRHAEIRISPHSCEIEDLDSLNGVFVNNERTKRALLRDGDSVQLGDGGPKFELQWKGAGRRGSKRKADDGIMTKLDRAAKGGPAGEETRIMLKVAHKYYKRHRKPYVIVSLIVLVVGLGAWGGAYYYFRQAERLKMLNTFYESRHVQADLLARPSISEVEKQGLRERRRKLEDEYDRYLEKIGWYAGKTPQQRAVMKMARRLGEADLDVPENFFETVMDYIKYWRRSGVLRQAWQRARSRHLLSMIRTHLAQHDLPQEFLFIALQESGFDYRAVGKPTRFGIAKGMWQMIPPTAKQFGLELGPDSDKPVFDASDMRHDEIRSTEAATNFIAELFATKAAASGLLVLASYNYGPSRITRNLDDLPNDPKVRSFWHFYRNQWLPDETRNYVFSIIAAALICEDPKLFDYDLGSLPNE